MGREGRGPPPVRFDAGRAEGGGFGWERVGAGGSGLNHIQPRSL